MNDGDLVRVTAERDALARHIEKLIALPTHSEAVELRANMAQHRQVGHDSDEAARRALESFIAERQRRGQFAAFS